MRAWKTTAGSKRGKHTRRKVSESQQHTLGIAQYPSGYLDQIDEIMLIVWAAYRGYGQVSKPMRRFCAIPNLKQTGKAYAFQSDTE